MSDNEPTQLDDDTPDPLIDEIRAIRKELSDRFDNDPIKLGQYLMELQKQYADRLVQPTPRVPTQKHSG